MIEDLRRALELLDEIESIYQNFPRFDDDFQDGRDAIKDLRKITHRALKRREQQLLRNSSILTIEVA